VALVEMQDMLTVATLIAAMRADDRADLIKNLPESRQDELLAYLVDSGTLAKISEELYFHSTAYSKALELLGDHFKDNDTLTLAQYRDLTGSSRKFVQALLEHFDQLKLTRRVEDHRVAFKLDLN
jgi:selenocysteine-specific elongation factor